MEKKYYQKPDTKTVKLAHQFRLLQDSWSQTGDHSNTNPSRRSWDIEE